MADTIRVFIGTEPKTEIARKVLEFSIRQRTKANVVFTPMIGPGWEYSTERFKQGTGFSLRRWMIPAFCNWTGRAIYLDADQLVFTDIEDLWTQPEQVVNKDASIWCTYQTDKFSPKKPLPQTSVMVIDCDKAQHENAGWRIERTLAYLSGMPKDTYSAFMHCKFTTGYWTRKKPQEISKNWNCLNTYDKKTTKLLHYTKEPEQPWYFPQHKLSALWHTELYAAMRDGVVLEREVVDAVAKFGVKEDWRGTNGLHPFYMKFVTSADGKQYAKSLGL